MKFVLATQNPKKKEELVAILGDLGVEIVTEEELGVRVEVEETGETFGENAALKNYYKPPFVKDKIFLDKAAMEKNGQELSQAFDIRGGENGAESGAMSGGNQQKLIIARELSMGASLLIFAQPTRGLDVGAIEFIRKKIIAERDAGKRKQSECLFHCHLLFLCLVTVLYDEIISKSRSPLKHKKRCARRARPTRLARELVGRTAPCVPPER